MEFTRAGYGFTDALIFPEPTNRVCDVVGEDFAFDLQRKAEDDVSAGVVLRSELDVEVRHGLEDSTEGSRNIE